MLTRHAHHRHAEAGGEESERTLLSASTRRQQLAQAGYVRRRTSACSRASQNVTTKMRIDTEELQRAVGTMSSEISTGVKQSFADVERTLTTASAEASGRHEAGCRAGGAHADDRVVRR